MSRLTTDPIHLAVYGVALWALVLLAIVMLAVLRYSGTFVVHLHWLAAFPAVGGAVVMAIGAWFIFAGLGSRS